MKRIYYYFLVKNRVLFLILGLIFLVGCAIFKPYQTLTPLEKAKVSCQVFYDWYLGTYLSIDAKLKNPEITQEEKDFLIEKVNPRMNELKKYIQKYTELVYLWEQTKFEPDNLNQIVNEIEKLISEIMRIYKE
ncbi:MAG TPA: hypothetical protein PLK48_06130 [Caldisericia bacterium]|nr:hypothetical protein [Caldisericia bacterium]